MKGAFRVVALAAAVVIAAPVEAQQFPNRPVRIMVGFGAGGLTDVLFRALADEMTKSLGQPVVVENRPGASSLVAVNAVKASSPDGYTLFGGGVSAVNPVFIKDGGVVASKEMSPVANVAFGDWFLYVPASLGVKSLAELSAWAKANPGKLRHGSAAVLNQMIFAVVSKRMGFQFENVPYKASDQVVLALLSGDIQVAFNAASGFGPHLQSGKLRSIAVLAPRRSDVYPDVPTGVEQGVPLEHRFAQQLWGPPGTPRDAVARLNTANADALKQPAMLERLRTASIGAAPSTPEELLRIYDNEVRFYTEAADLIGFKPQ